MILITIVLLFFTLIDEEYIPASVVAVLAILGFVYHPKKMKDTYVVQIKKIAKEYKSHINIKYELLINNTCLNIKTEIREIKLQTLEINQIIETQEYFFLKCKPEIIIIPKIDLHNKDEIRQEFAKLSERLEVEFSSEMDWKW